MKTTLAGVLAVYGIGCGIAFSGPAQDAQHADWKIARTALVMRWEKDQIASHRSDEGLRFRAQDAARWSLRFIAATETPSAFHDYAIGSTLLAAQE